MFKREMKINFKSYIIWTSVLIGLFLIVFLVYPSIINSENMEMIDEMIKIFPEEILKAFNMDISSIDTAFGWLKTEGFVFVLLVTGIYSGILGSNILVKEESDKTIEYLNSVPVTRKSIVLSYILLSMTPLFTSIVIFMICLFLSTFAHKTKKTFGISLGIVFASYFLNVISEMGESTEFLKYLSIFTLADIRNVIINASINPVMIVLTIVISGILIALTMIRYEKKELL